MKAFKFFRKDILIFIIGLALVCYPIASNYFESKEQNSLISTYQSKADKLNQDQIKMQLESAKKWNDNLFLSQSGLSTGLNDLKYEDVLNIENDVIGSIEIPKIEVNIPIFRGTDADKLSVGAGHLEDSSFPVGGKNTHTVLTAHRGLPSSKLFTRLDELTKNDVFYLKVLNQTLAYKIDEIEVLRPEEVSYPIQSERDLATLITCTPYGLNTHRLVLSGHRIPYIESDKEKIKSKLPSLREIAFYTIPLVFSITGIFIFRKKKGAE